jgi:hypothetical protein
MATGDDAFCRLRETLHMGTDHEEGRANLVLREHIKNAFCVRAWSIIKRQCHRLQIRPAAPISATEPLRAHRVGSVINGGSAGQQRRAPYQ